MSFLSVIKYAGYIGTGINVMIVLLAKVPKIVEDKKVSIEEIADLLTGIFHAAGWQNDIEVPDEIKGKTLALTETVGNRY